MPREPMADMAHRLEGEEDKLVQIHQGDLKPVAGLTLTPLRRSARLPPRNGSGQVAEWLKAHAWRACIRQKRIAGSNPALSVPDSSQRVATRPDRPRPDRGSLHPAG